jgi:xanthine/CO dehydrogenase XdhC/CoxF family maturation factor
MTILIQMIESKNINIPFREVLQIINNLDQRRNLSSGDNIILSTICSNGLYLKQITSVIKLYNSGYQKLASFASDIEISGKSVGTISYKDNSGIEYTEIVEVIQAPKSIIILGAGHVGRCLSIMSSTLGFNVVLIDDREEFLSDENLKSYNIKKILSSFDRYHGSTIITSNCAIVIVTRGHQFDEICLRIAIDTDAKYIGMIGSKRRVLAITNNLKQMNLTERQSLKLDRIYAPIGLRIGAETPQEIAVSILAQVIQVMNSNQTN